MADAVRGRLGAAGIPVAPHLPIAKRQRPKEAGALAARPRVLRWEGMVLAHWEEHGPPAFPSSLTARLSFVWRSCSLSLCVTGVLGSRPTQPAPGRRAPALGAFTLLQFVLSAGEDSGSSASQSTPAGVEQNQMGRKEAKSPGKTTGDLWQLGRSRRSPGMDKMPLRGLT